MVYGLMCLRWSLGPSSSLVNPTTENNLQVHNTNSQNTCCSYEHIWCHGLLICLYRMRQWVPNIVMIRSNYDSKKLRENYIFLYCMRDRHLILCLQLDKKGEKNEELFWCQDSSIQVITWLPSSGCLRYKQKFDLSHTFCVWDRSKNP